MKLIKEWREAWKFGSVQTALILAVANAVFMLLPELQPALPSWLYSLIMIVGNVSIVALRLVSQGITDNDETEIS